MTGVVVSPTGRPIPDLRVSVAGRPAVTTDAGGRFEFTAVPTPYTAVVARSEWSEATVFEGLTRPDPVLPFTPATSFSQSGYVCGTTSGPPGLPYEAWVLTETAAGSGDAVRNLTEWFCTGRSWNGPLEVAATVHVLVSITRDLTDAPPSWVATSFPASGSAEVLLTDGVRKEGAGVSLSPGSASSLGVSAALPAGWSAMLTVDGFFGPAHFQGFPFGFVMGASSWPPVAVPDLPGLRTHVWVWGTGPEGGTHVHRILDAPLPSALALTVPPAHRLLSPAEGATGGGPGTRFSWTAFADADLSVFRLSGNDGLSVTIYSNDPGVELPDLSPVGISYAAGATVWWDALDLSSSGGVDGITTFAGIARADLDGRSVSEDREFAYVAVPRTLTLR